MSQTEWKLVPTELTQKMLDATDEYVDVDPIYTQLLAAAPSPPEEMVREIVRTAMQDAWNDICSDTGCHPLDIEQAKRVLTFHPRHWADAVARAIFAKLGGG